MSKVLAKDQKINKVRNIIQVMSKRDGSIINCATSRQPRWEKVLLKWLVL